MKKTAFIFPGQGAQYIGMAIDFLENREEFQNNLNDFKIRTEVDLLKIMQEGPEEKLKDTQFTQPAILFHSVAAWKTFTDQVNITPAFVAGHSLGEFSALVANGVLSFNDAMYLVHKRGQYMIKANEGKPFAMYAIIGLDPDTVKSICETASQTDVVIAANFNTPVQTVISGSKAGVEKAGELASEAGAKRIIPLAVGGPFHSPLIAKAAQWLTEEMADLNFQDAELPVVSNVDARPETDAEKIKSNLSRQIISSVLWVDTINYLTQQGVEQFIEFGPQKVLAGMMRKIDKKITVYSIDKFEDVSKIREILEQE
jgi:[acyl-carrier-protein] S-malonyltransferase